jgi:hypothetical protein
LERRTLPSHQFQRWLDHGRTVGGCRCPKLKIVLLLGRAAEDGWALAGLSGSLEVVVAPHPSMRGLNSHGGRERFEKAIAQLARALNEK